MISVEEALTILENNCVRGPVQKVRLADATGGVLAADVFAAINLPPFDQSAMDGYALSIGSSKTYRLVGEVQAGDSPDLDLQKGEAVRIFTGAPVPRGADAVVMQEHVKVEGSEIYVDAPVREGDNIRPCGEEIQEGDQALEKGTILNPAAIGYLANLGVGRVSMYKKPAITIISTGNELVPPGQQLAYGQIYESNAAQLSAALQLIRLPEVSSLHVRDDYEATRSEISAALERSDILILTGGISVGDYDFVGKSLRELQVKELFYKVAQKPGKPIFFGKKGGTSVFALPGNPASCLVGFYMYVLPAIRHFIGYKDVHLRRERRKITTDFEKKSGRTLFLKARLHAGREVEILEGQGSAMLHSFALADALVRLPAGDTIVDKGSEVETIVLPITG